VPEQLGHIGPDRLYYSYRSDIQTYPDAVKCCRDIPPYGAFKVVEMKNNFTISGVYKII